MSDLLTIAILAAIAYYVQRWIRNGPERRAAKEKSQADRARWLESPMPLLDALDEVRRARQEGRDEDAMSLGDDVIRQEEWLGSRMGETAILRHPTAQPRSGEFLHSDWGLLGMLMMEVAGARIDVAERSGDLQLARAACDLAARAQNNWKRRLLEYDGFPEPAPAAMAICKRRADMFTARGLEIPRQGETMEL